MNIPIKMSCRFFSVLFLLFFGTASGQGTWSTIAFYPASPALSDGISFSIGAYGYVGTGMYPPIVTSQLFWRYDPANDTWTQVASLPGPGRWEAVGFALNGKGYCALGFDGTTMLNDVWQYDPVLNSWTQKNNYPAPNRFEATAFVVQNRAFIACGQNPNYMMMSTVCEYDPVADTWTQKNNFPGTARMSLASFTANNTAYMGLGKGVINTSVDLNDLWKYDHVNDSWTQVNSFPDSARHDVVAFGICQYGFVGTGCYGSATGLFKNFYRYDALADSWTAIPDKPGQRIMEATAFVVGDEAFVGTGYNGGQFVPHFYKYDWQDTCLLKSVNELSSGPAGVTCFADRVTEKINFEFRDKPDAAVIRIYNVQGEKVFEESVSNNRFAVSSSSYAPGIYVWNAQGRDGRSFSGKFYLGH